MVLLKLQHFCGHNIQYYLSPLWTRRFCTIPKPPLVKYDFNYSAEETQKILSVLNESSLELLSRYDITAVRATQLARHRKKKGNFATLSNILDVNGFGVKIVDKLCCSILHGETKSVKRKESKGIIPIITKEYQEKISTVVGLQLNFQMLSWANVDKEGTIQDWNLKKWDLEEKRKQHPTNVYYMLSQILAELPVADLYLLQEPQPPPQQSTFISWYVQQRETNAMLLALLNVQRSKQPMNFCVAYVRSSIISRTFGIRVGSERVSGQVIVKEMLDGVKWTVFSDLGVSEEIRERYGRMTGVESETMCQALFLPLVYWKFALT